MLSSLSIVPFILQETVETGPPVEVQVRLNTGVTASSNWKVISSGIVIWPVGRENRNTNYFAIFWQYVLLHWVAKNGSYLQIVPNGSKKVHNKNRD